MGPEPLGLDFTPGYLAERWAARTAPLKALLLNQSMIAGLGNIYTDECLWTAQLSPTRAAGTLTDGEYERLHRAIQQVLGKAIEMRGTTFSDALDLYGQKGSYQYHLK